MQQSNDRYNRGMEIINAIDEKTGELLIQSLQEICPDLGQYIVEYSCGDILHREGLTLQQRELITLAMLGAQGNCKPQLEIHVNGALNVGCSPIEIIETLLQLSVYAGFPAALNAMGIAKKVFSERGVIAVPPV